jgi:phenylalanyl-tRNA synthetase beta chain
MKILTHWLRTFLPTLPVDYRQLADDLTLRGIAVEGVHPLPTGHLFEMDITTNRVDAMNHYGIAREAATIYNLPLAPLDTTLPEPVSAQPFPIAIEAQNLCGRFTARILRNVTIAPSSGQVAEFFSLLSQKQISNAVDASNFVLLGMGQPTHAFDLDKIEGGIVVRLAREGETVKLLDGRVITLSPEDLVVADHTKPLGLAGVMGGWDSMITPETRNILVEAAWFDPAAIRSSARRHGLHTDASHRFERGADFNAAPTANHLVAGLILQSGGTLEGDLIDLIVPEIQQKTATRPPIALSVRQVQRHLGTTLAPEGITSPIIRQYLESLGCQLTPVSEDEFQTQLPSWRLDLEREIDLIEEVARVYGYNRFANTLPTPLPVTAHPLAAVEHAVRTRLLALGFSESISSTFASPAEAQFFAPNEPSVPMENPLSEEASLLRPSLVPGMLTMLAHNLNRDVKEVRLFEQGQVFTGCPCDVHENPSLTLGLTTATEDFHRIYPEGTAPIFELKGALESLLSLFALTPTYTTSDLPQWLEPGRAAAAHIPGLDAPIAVFGQLATPESTRRKLRQPVSLAQIDLAALYAHPLKKVTAHDLSRYQAVERDFSFVFPNAVLWQQVSDAITNLAIPELQTIRPIELWRDSKKYPGVYSLLTRVLFQSPDRTLSETELTTASTRIIEALTALGGTLRAG